MVEEDARTGKQPVALTVVHRDVVPVDLGHPVRAPRVERRQLGLRDLADLAEHFARGGLVEANLRIHLPYGFEDPRDPLRVELPGQHRLFPGSGHERHGRQVVELVRPNIGEHADQRELVQEIRRPQLNTIEQMFDPPQIGRAGSADDADDLVAFVEEQLGQVGAVLTRDAGDDRALSQ